MKDSPHVCITWRRLARPWPVASVEVVDFDLRQLRLDPAELPVGQVDVGASGG